LDLFKVVLGAWSDLEAVPEPASGESRIADWPGHLKAASQKISGGDWAAYTTDVSNRLEPDL
jgi:hypothetical protein